MREIESHKRERATKMAKIVAHDFNESSTWKYIKEIEKKNFTRDTKQSQVLWNKFIWIFANGAFSHFVILSA